MVIFNINSHNKFLEHNYNSVITLSSEPTISGSMVNKSLHETLLSSIGEFKEREFLYSYNYFIEGGKIKLLNLYTGQSEERYFDQEVEKFFFDSSGCACHIRTEKALENAFFEFIERQVYLFVYLTKSRVSKLEFSSDIKRYLIPKKYNNLNVYNISPISSVFVILVYGWIEGDIYISLGASNSLEKAISKSIKELEQLDYIYSTKAKWDTSQYLSDEVNYFKMFMSISNEQLKYSFKFLDDAIIKEVRLKKMKQEFNTATILGDIKKEFDMEPRVVFLNSTAVKVVKVLDFNWFPSLLPKMISPENISFIENKTNRVLDRNCNFVPFP